MKKLFVILIILISYTKTLPQELRATWIARDVFFSKENLAQAIDSLAAANFNVIYVNAWSRGYPLWQSDIFYSETGSKIDPTYNGRDILAEAIAEGHKRGMHVEAWFEYGFVGGWTGNIPNGEKGPIFKIHPDWVAKKLDGSEKDNSNFYWMIHTHPQVQQFLISLAKEVGDKYDIDGIELDRIRYASVDYGYDSYTDSLYKIEHNSSSPPNNSSDPTWLKWRADKLNLFMKACYDSIKAVNRHVNVSNAPSLYGTEYTSYYSFCQDWFWWVNNLAVDNVQVQSYVTSPQSLGNILDYVSTKINDKSRIFPAIAVAPNGNVLSKETIQQFFDLTKSKGFLGNSIWYYSDLKNNNLFTWLKNGAYSSKVYLPFKAKDWREYYQIIPVSDTINAKRTGSWTQSSLSGLNGPSIYSFSSDPSSINYYCDVPVEGNYEIYVFVVQAVNRSSNAEYTVFDSNRNEKIIYVDQTNVNNRRWYKLGDFYLAKGKNLTVRLTNNGLEYGKSLSADGILISLNRKLSPDASTGIEEKKSPAEKINHNFNLKNFPNPFNNQTRISFNLNSSNLYTLQIFNIVGEKIFTINKIGKTGLNYLDFNSDGLASGIYLCSISQNNYTETMKIVLTK
ncbi:MAG: family 10 glycosylhydrolase [Ignavibacteriales bacterium]|nr:family 10 glycosylhydrolase [Ignavibacteriales bacterium]